MISTDSHRVNRILKLEKWLIGLLVLIVTLFFIFAGLHLLFGPEESRLARTSSTLLPAFGWAVAMWLFLCIFGAIGIRACFLMVVLLHLAYRKCIESKL